LKEFQKIEAHKKKQELDAPVTIVDKNILLRTDSTNMLSDFAEHKIALNSPNISSDLRNSARGNAPKARHSGTLDTFTSIFKRKAAGDRNSKRGENEPGNTNSLRGSKFALPFLKGSKMKESDESLPQDAIKDNENHETENETKTVPEILESPKDTELSPKSSDTTEKEIADIKNNEEKESQDKDKKEREEIKENNINENDKERQKMMEKELILKPKAKLRERFSSFRKNKDKEEQKQADPSPLST